MVLNRNICLKYPDNFLISILLLHRNQHACPSIPHYEWICGATASTVHGERAYRTDHQFVVCLQGSCAVLTDDGRQRWEFVLEGGRFGLYVPPGIWTTVSRFSLNAVTAILISGDDQSDVLRDYTEFLKFAGRAGHE